MAKANVVKQIRRATRRKFSAEEKIRIVPKGFAAELPLPSYAGGKTLLQMYITDGPKNSSKPVKTV